MRKLVLLALALALALVAVACDGGGGHSYGAPGRPYDGVFVTDFKIGDHVTVLEDHYGDRTLLRDERTGDTFWLYAWDVGYSYIDKEGRETLAEWRDYQGHPTELVVEWPHCGGIVTRDAKRALTAEDRTIQVYSKDLCLKVRKE